MSTILPAPDPSTTAENTPQDYGTTLRVVLSMIAIADKKRLAAEASVGALTAKLSKKEKLVARDLALLTQIDQAHKAGQETKKEIEVHLAHLKKATADPICLVLQKAPLSLTLEGYTFTLSTTPNSVNAWMLDMRVDYQPVG